MVADWHQLGIRVATDGLAKSAPANPTTLPEPVRQIAYMALLGIVLLGMLLVVATLLGGHWVRRLGNNVRRRSLPPELLIPRSSGTTELADPDQPNDGETFSGNDTKII